MSFPIYTSIPPKFDATSAIASWRNAGFSVISINSSAEAEAVRAKGVTVVEIPGSDNRTSLGSIFATAATAGPCAGVINADCLIAAGISAADIRENLQRSCLVVQRVEVGPDLKATGAFIFGFDAAFFDTEILSALRPNSQYKMGVPWWDYWLPIACIRGGIPLSVSEPPFLLHETHEQRWNEEEFRRLAGVFREEFADLFLECEDDRELAVRAYNLISSSPRLSIQGLSAELEKDYSELAATANKRRLKTAQDIDRLKSSNLLRIFVRSRNFVRTAIKRR